MFPNDGNCNICTDDKKYSKVTVDSNELCVNIPVINTVSPSYVED